MKKRVRLGFLAALTSVLPALQPAASYGDQLALIPDVPGASQFFINDPAIWFSQAQQMTVVPTSADDLQISADDLIGSGSAPPIVLLLDDVNGGNLITAAFQSLTIAGPTGLSISRDGSADLQLVLGDGTAPDSMLYVQNAAVDLSANVAVRGVAALADRLTLAQSGNLELTTFSATGLQLGGGNPATGVFTSGALVVGANTRGEIDGTVTVLDGAGANAISVSGDALANGHFIAGGITSEAASADILLNVGPFGVAEVSGAITSSNSVGAVLNATGGTATLSDISLQDIVGNVISASGSAQVTVGVTTISGNAGNTVFAASGTAVVSALDVTGGGASHLNNSLVTAANQSTVTLGNVTLQDVDGPLIQSTSSGKVTVGDVLINGTLNGEVVLATNGATVNVGNIDIGLSGQLAGPLVTASGTGTTVTFGNVGNLLREGSFFVYPSFSSTLLSVTGGAHVTGGLVNVGSLDTPQGILVDGSTLSLDGLSVATNTGSSILVEGGGRLTIGKDAPFPNFGTLTHSVSFEQGTFQINIFASSVFNTPAGMELQAMHPETMQIDHSEWDGNMNYAYDLESVGGNHTANLVVSDLSTLNNLPFFFWFGVTSSFDHTTLNNVNMSIQFGSQATVSNSTWKSGQISLADNSTNAGLYNGTGLIAISNSHLFDLVMLTAANTGGTAQMILDNTIANMGEIQASVSDTTGGTTTMTVRNQSQLWTYTSLDMGASKRAPNFGIWPVITEHTGDAHLVIQSGGRVVVGGSVRADGSFSTFTSDVSLTLGAGSDISIDNTSAMYVGRIFSTGQAIFNTGALTLGHAGWIFGNGTILADVINDGGTVSPGYSPGHLTIGGSYVQNSGELDIEIAGPGAGQFDQLTASSFHFLGGEIVLSLYGSGYTGADLAGQTLHFFDGGTVAMSNTQFIDQTGLGLQLVNGSVTFPGTPVPEPASLAVLGLGVAALLRRRRQAIKR